MVGGEPSPKSINDIGMRLPGKKNCLLLRLPREFYSVARFFASAPDDKELGVFIECGADNFGAEDVPVCGIERFSIVQLQMGGQG